MSNNKFYQVSQNNSGGQFVSNDKLCGKLFIEADSAEEAANIAESLGCYWNGCDKGMDCSCCGDRWYPPHSPIELNDFVVTNWFEGDIDDTIAIESFKSMYLCFPNVTWLVEPIASNTFCSTKFYTIVTGTIKVGSIELYAQILVNQSNYGMHITPAARIFYKNGDIKEICFNKAKVKTV